MSGVDARAQLDIAADELDFIGDVHGCAHTLERLLGQLGYSKHRGVYAHPSRRAVFVGDIIDRGPRIREAMALVRDMVERGSAHLVLGNHELNALCYCTPHPSAPGNYLRPHTPRNTRIIHETLEQFADYTDDWHDHLNWLKTRPLFLQMPGAQVVHACWDRRIIAERSCYIEAHEWPQLADPASRSARQIKRLTSGLELPLPQGQTMTSAEGYSRHTFRANFWTEKPQTLGELAFQPDPLPPAVARKAVDEALMRGLVVYDRGQPPLFVGHYWLSGTPAPVASNIACLDYSAVKFGRLVAYRGDGHSQIDRRQFVWVYVDP